MAVATSEVRRWYQRAGLWVSISLAALVVAPVLVGVLGVLPLEGFAFFAISLLGLVVLALIPVGLWMGALVARRNWSRGILVVSTLLVLFLAAWAVWNYLEASEFEAEEECFLIPGSTLAHDESPLGNYTSQEALPSTNPGSSFQRFRPSTHLSDRLPTDQIEDWTWGSAGIEGGGDPGEDEAFPSTNPEAFPSTNPESPLPGFRPLTQ